MKYAGSISIVKDGDVVYERDLTSDEIIAALLDDASRVVAPVIEPNGAEEPAADWGKRPVKHKCCGSKGFRHKNGCTTQEPVRSVAKVGERKPSSCSHCSMIGHQKRTCPKLTKEDLPPVSPEDKGRMLTDDEFAEVKRLRNDEEMNSKEIADELDLPAQQVNYALVTPHYEAYRKHFEYQNK